MRIGYKCIHNLLRNKIVSSSNNLKCDMIGKSQFIHRGTGIRGLMRGMATLTQGNQELLVVIDKVGRPQVSLG